mgnify:CR=1
MLAWNLFKVCQRARKIFPLCIQKSAKNSQKQFCQRPINSIYLKELRLLNQKARPLVLFGTVLAFILTNGF